MEAVPMVYKINILESLRDKGYTTSILRKDKILSESTLTCIRQRKPISWRAIETICKLLECQPGDILIMQEKD